MLVLVSVVLRLLFHVHKLHYFSNAGDKLRFRAENMYCKES